MRLTIVLTVLLLFLPVVATAVVDTLPITQVWQHKDTAMVCTAGCGAAVHAANHAVNPPPGCGHCGYYCAPASIAMFSLYRGNAGPAVQQDDIYDHGKFTQGEILGDGILQTHGVGMFDGVTPTGLGGAEVQTAFLWSLGSLVQWGVNVGMPPLTEAYLQTSIRDGTPVLWCDHYGYPPEIYPPLPEEWAEVNGHAKIIAGYDDMDTAVFADDLVQIYDPWPTSGSPYWTPVGNVLDPRDVFMSDYDVVATEPSTWGRVKTLFR